MRLREVTDSVPKGKGSTGFEREERDLSLDRRRVPENVALG